MGRRAGGATHAACRAAVRFPRGVAVLLAAGTRPVWASAPSEHALGGANPACDRYTVQRGDTLKKIAARFGLTVALKDGRIGEYRLEDVAGVPKPVDPQDQTVITARDINISFGD